MNFIQKILCNYFGVWCPKHTSSSKYTSSPKHTSSRKRSSTREHPLDDNGPDIDGTDYMDHLGPSRGGVTRKRRRRRRKN